MSDRTRVYVAGPISKGELSDNLAKGREAADKLFAAGYAPFLPHLSCYWGGDVPDKTGNGHTLEEWLGLDLAWVAVADALVRIPGESVGADAEVKFALSRRVPVYYGVESFLARESMPSLVAFTGYAGTGKDEAAKTLLGMGYKRYNFGDIIKSQVDPIVRQYFGFSAFTEVSEQKARIRRMLESWGEDNYDAIMSEFFSGLGPRSVNTRLVRLREAEAWRERGGVIILVERPNVGPATLWEKDRLDELMAAGVVNRTLVNDGDSKQLGDRLLHMLRGLRT